MINVTVVYERKALSSKRYLVQWSLSEEDWFDSARWNWLWAAKLSLILIATPRVQYRILDTWG